MIKSIYSNLKFFDKIPTLFFIYNFLFIFVLLKIYIFFFNEVSIYYILSIFLLVTFNECRNARIQFEKKINYSNN